MTSYHCEKECCTIMVRDYDQPFYKRRNCKKAGVFIYDPEEERVLLVQSRGQLWGSPKGTLEVDLDEDDIQCAVREVKEETGLDIDPDTLSNYVRIKNRATYYYLEHPTCETKIQEFEENDANGITWIRLECLEKCVKDGKIILSKHSQILFKRFLGKTFPRSDFIRVSRRRKKRIKEKWISN